MTTSKQLVCRAAAAVAALSSWCLACLVLFCAQALPAEQVRVMQWNVKGALGSTANNSSAAAQAIARIVNYNQPDVLLFNEVKDATAATAALINWVTNNVPYLGTQPGVTFFVAVSPLGDGFSCNGAISRYPILNETTYDDGLRGLHAFKVQFATTNLQVFHAHLKCCSDGTSCSRKQTEAEFDSDIINAFAATNSLPYIFGGDWNEDEEDAMCTLSATYHPITTIRTNGGLAEFKPTTLSGQWLTWSTAATPSIRFDYLLAASARLSPVTGFVFSTMDWAAQGLYTNAGAQNLADDSQTASDHFCVFADYSFSAPGPSLAVSPPSGLTSTGGTGGPFSPSSQIYTLTNTGAGSLNWTASKTANWLTLSASSGTLNPGAGTAVTVSVNASANGLGAGSYADTVSFANADSGAGNTTRGVSLTVGSFGFYDDFSAYAAGNLVGQSNWVQTGSASGTPLQVSSGKVTIAGGQMTDTQDAYKNFTQTNSTLFYGLTLTVTNAVNSTSASYFTALYTGNNAAGFANYRLTAKAGDAYLTNCVLGIRVTGQTGDPYTFGTATLSTGIQYRVIVQAPSGYASAALYVNPTSGDLAAQTAYANNPIGTGTPPLSLGSLVISQYGTPSIPTDGVSIGKVIVSDSFAAVYNFLMPTVPPPVASFSGNPTSGAEPVTVAFTDTSTGSITNRLWTFGDGATSNTTATSVSHVYAAGTYDVTLLASGPGGVSTNSRSDYVVVLTPFQNWQVLYFGSSTNVDAALAADPDLDGMSNWAEFLAGTIPTNSASAFRMATVAQEGDDLRVSWTTGSGRTNVVQRAGGLGGTDTFTDVFTVLTSGSATNYLDVGAATNGTGWFYRVRLAP